MDECDANSGDQKEDEVLILNMRGRIFKTGKNWTRYCGHNNSEFDAP